MTRYAWAACAAMVIGLGALAGCERDRTVSHTRDVDVNRRGDSVTERERTTKVTSDGDVIKEDSKTRRTW